MEHDAMVEPPQGEPPRYWSQSTSSARWQRRNDSAVHRFFGGSPAAVLVKLLVVSFLVGALLVWLDIRPADVFREFSDMLDRIWALGFRSIRDFGTYIIAGAVIVVPIWLIMRLLSYRGR